MEIINTNPMPKKTRNNEHLGSFVTVNGVQYAYHPETGLDGVAITEINPYIIREALKFLHSFPNSSVELDDLVQEARLGALKAAKRFDPSRGVGFLTYASFWIRAALLETYGKTLIHTPRGQKSVFIAHMELDSIEAYDQSDLAEDLERRELLKVVLLKMQSLPESKKSLLLRYASGASLAEIAQERGFSRQRASQILRESCALVRASIAA